MLDLPGRAAISDYLPLLGLRACPNDQWSRYGDKMRRLNVENGEVRGTKLPVMTSVKGDGHPDKGGCHKPNQEGKRRKK